MIFNEVFDACYQQLAGQGRGMREAYERKRYNRALLALRCQNYFLSASFTNTSGAAAVTGTDRTQALERPLIIRGGGMNAIFIGDSALTFKTPDTGALNGQVLRNGSIRAHLSKYILGNSHYFYTGDSVQCVLD